MINIYLSEGQLDMYDSDVNITRTAMRFSTEIRKPYSNDFELPKTEHNIQLLGCYSLLDRTNQMYGEQLRPAILEINSQPMDVYIQVVSITSTAITICVFENVIPQEITNKYISDFVKDDANTIIEWNKNSVVNYPSMVKRYNYGAPYNANIAQYHTSMPLISTLQKVGQNAHVSLPNVDSKYYMVATNKYVCPQNQIQLIEGKSNNGTFIISGGQHVTNDLEYDANSDQTTITFNRKCNISATAYVSWNRHGTSNQSYNFSAVRRHNGVAVTRNLQLHPESKTNSVDTFTFNYVIEANDTLHFNLSNYSKFDFVDFVVVMNITNYDVTDDDYNTELQYVGRLPKLKIKDFATGQTRDFDFDGSGEHTYTYNNATSVGHFDLPRKSLSYFAYYCNLPKVKLCDCLHSLQWVVGKKLEWSDYSLKYVDFNKSVIINDATIDVTRPNSSNVGQKNYIKYSGETNATSVTTIDNIWLEDEKAIHTSCFGNVTPYNLVKQYTKEVDDNGNVTYSYDALDTPILMETATTTMLKRINLQTLGFEAITSVIEVELTTYNDQCNDADYLFIDGRKFMVEEITKDFSVEKSTITALLVPTN